LFQPADTLSLKTKILYWIENKQLLEFLHGFSQQHAVKADNKHIQMEKKGS